MRNRVTRLPKFADSRGWSLNDIYGMFDGYPYQVNYSILYPGIIKAWHRHEHQDDYFCILKGMAQVYTLMRMVPRSSLLESITLL